MIVIYVGRAAGLVALVWLLAHVASRGMPASRIAWLLRRWLFPFALPLITLWAIIAVAHNRMDVAGVAFTAAVSHCWTYDLVARISDGDPDDDEDRDDQDDDEPGDGEDDPDDDDDDGDGETWTDRARRVVKNLTGAGPRLKVLPTGA